MSAQQVAKSYDEFYFNEKNIIFPMFHELKNTKLNHFSPISKFVNFWVLQIYPP